MDLDKIIQGLQTGELDRSEAQRLLKKEMFLDLGFAKVDTFRKNLQHSPEVIYGEGKTANEIFEIAKVLWEKHKRNVLITRIDGVKADKLKEMCCDAIPLQYYERARMAILGEDIHIDGNGKILIVSAGTSDMAVCEEAYHTARVLGNEVEVLYDVGVAGLHRLLQHLDTIWEADVIIVVAGMEGALASVVGGLVDVPVIAVPTAIGYGANFGGLSALLGMLNSCASGVSVVNIDNGFGAAVLASKINHMGRKKK